MVWLLFVIVPLVELYLLLAVGSLVGFWPTVLLVLVTGMLGASLARREGFRVLRRWQEALARGEMPEEGVLGGLLVLVGGVLLITPGVLTDAVGLLLLLPPSRRWIGRWLMRYVQAHSIHTSTTFTSFSGGAPFVGRDMRGPFSTTSAHGRGREPHPPIIETYGEEVDS